MIKNIAQYQNYNEYSTKLASLEIGEWNKKLHISRMVSISVQ